MNKAEIMVKINNVKNKESKCESFVRPPEEIGDAVKLFYNDRENVFRAVVYDPDTHTDSYEKTLPNEDHAYSFIKQILEGTMAKADINQNPNQIEYLNIYWDEWR